MAISFKRYVDITSGVGAGVRVPGRELIGRIFTSNALVPTATIVEFEEAAEVADFFGSTSEEYKRAAQYFGFISKTQTRPRKLSFERWVPHAAPATLRGTGSLPALDVLQNISDGSFSFSLNGITADVINRDFSSATSYADIANILEAGIRAKSSDRLWTDATVSFDAKAQIFLFTAGVAGACAIEPASGLPVGTNVAEMIGWDKAHAIVSDGYDAMTVTDTLNRSADQSNNFGSFLFIGEFSTEEMEEAAVFANVSNVQFMFCQRVTRANAAAVRESLKGYNGTALVEYDPSIKDEYPEMIPMILLAATDYTRLNGTINYMFHQFPTLKPTVTANQKANELDELRVNYIGRTQQAGQLIDFFQRGVLQGEIQDMNIYANEMWLKDRAGADIMTLKLALPKISANATGKAQITGCLQNVIGMAINNGTISINKALNYTQKSFITLVTGDDQAWVQVESQGYWLDVQIEEYTVDDRIEYKVVYLLIYAKDDVIRKTEGTHSLI